MRNDSLKKCGKHFAKMIDNQQVDITTQLQKMNVEEEKIINYDFFAREDQVLLSYTTLTNND